MSGLLSGLLGILALPPIDVPLVGLVWLVPWLTRLNQPSRQRIANALLTIGLPLGFVLGPITPAETMAVAGGMALAMVPFALIGAVAADPAGRTSGLRLLLCLGLLCVLLAGVRRAGLPLSLSIFAPAHSGHMRLIQGAGILGADLIIACFQAMLAVVLMRASSGQWDAGMAFMRIGIATTALLLPPAAMVFVTETVDHFPARSIAVIQTDIRPWERDRAITDGVLERIKARQERLYRTALALGPDVVVWPESSAPGYLQPDWSTDGEAGGRGFRHGYRYLAPGYVASVVQTRPDNGRARRWPKYRPIPFAESHLAPASINTASMPTTADGLTPLICSDASHPEALRMATSGRAGLIINPTNNAYLGSPFLARMHQRATQREAARAGVPVLVVANGGPSALLRPDGQQKTLLGAYQRGVARVTVMPERESAALPGLAVFLLMAISIGMTACLATGRIAAVPERQCQSRASRWLLALPVFMLAAGLTQHRLWLAETGIDDSSPPIAPGSMAAIHSPDAPHRGAMALLAREFGLSLGWQDVPADPASARRWLCRKTGLRLRERRLRTVGPPALGLHLTPAGSQAVRWIPGGEPTAWDPVSGQFHAVDPESVRWLTTARSPDQCRSTPLPP
ncbi:nitrilase-related carbon-nitrogen hydrolase [Spiribacter onubensis]|uniref:Nitrilase-related carbon-nitrogen hydrolase n=1 Tax=Spiribacter onubensis TaxID=3122420 RepID=A0ABV3S8P6_9GAMM